jgi:hypothetical protein
VYIPFASPDIGIGYASACILILEYARETPIISSNSIFRTFWNGYYKIK